MNLKGAKILVTGADGFIGSHLVESLYQYGAKIRALTYYNSFNNWGWLEDLNCINQIEVISGDIRDAHFCKKLAKDIDIIFHLAALIAIPYSYKAPESFVDTNIKGTLNICEAALENECHVIHTSTSEVYGTAKYVPIDELHPLQPQSPYSASKIGADSIAMSFHNSFSLPVTIARPFNTYGPRQSARAVIPTIITQMINQKETIKLGDLRPTRDFNYVKDTCNGLVLLAENDSTIGKIFNIGSNTEISIAELFELLKKLTASGAIIENESQRMRPENSEVHRLVCENRKIKEATGFQPDFTLEQGLSETIEWFKNSQNIRKYKSDIYNV